MLIKSLGIFVPGVGFRTMTTVDRTPRPRSSVWSAVWFLVPAARQNRQLNSQNYRLHTWLVTSESHRAVGGSISILKASLVKLMCRLGLSDRQEKRK